MANYEVPEIPEEWKQELVDLRAKVRDLPEDEEDRLIRVGEARYNAMSPEEQAASDREVDEILARMQTPEFKAAADRFFSGLGHTGLDDSQPTKK